MIERLRARFPEDCKTLVAWLEENNRSALDGKRENQNWKEWWCLLRLFEVGFAEEIFPTRFYAEWLSGDGEADFRISTDQDLIFLEVTEATSEEDRRAMSLSRNIHSPMLLGEDFHVDGKLVPGGRGKGGFEGDFPEQAMANDIEEAIRRKANKCYAEESILLVYPNSNLWMADRNEVRDLLIGRRISFPFRQCIVLFDKEMAFVLPSDPLVSPG